MKRTDNRTLSLLLALVLGGLPCLAATASAEPEVVTTALSNDGRVISLLQGTYGELFPEGSEATTDEAALALRIVGTDKTETLLPIPATLDGAWEESCELVVDPTSGTSYVFWQSQTNQIHSRFFVSSFDGEAWSEPIEVSGAPFSLKSSPAFAVTHDAYYDLGSADGSEPRRVNRTTLHLIWSEESRNGSWVTMYTPLILEDGRYVDEHPMIVLDDLLGDSPASGPPATRTDIHPVIEVADGGSSAVAAFLDEVANQVVAVKLDFVPGEISALASQVEEALESAAGTLDTTDAEAVAGLADDIHSRVLGFGSRFQPEILRAVNDRLDDFIVDRLGQGDDLHAVAGGARAQIVDVGFRLKDSPIQRVVGDERAQIVDVGYRAGGPTRDSRHDLRMSVLKTQSLADVGFENPQLLVSESGRRLVLAVPAGTSLAYRETTEDGWTELRRIEIRGAMSLETAYAILRTRAARH
jgi:hypothetical protein